MDTLKNYTFLPWLRQGIAAEIPVTDKLGSDGSATLPERAELSVSFNVNGQPVSKQVQLLGPGDVVGINPRAVVKTEPRNFVTDFEANYLPYIEFYEEDFPWRFTPAKAANVLEQSRLRPWIFLIVLAEDEFDEKSASGPLGAFEIKEEVDPNKLFPSKKQSWAWAHVHVSQNIIGNKLQTTTNQDARLVEQNLEHTLGINSDNASSRLLCPRKLRESYCLSCLRNPGLRNRAVSGIGIGHPRGIDGQLASGVPVNDFIRFIIVGLSAPEPKAILNSWLICLNRDPWINAWVFATWTCSNLAMRWTACRLRSTSWVWKGRLRALKRNLFRYSGRQRIPILKILPRARREIF